MPCGNARPALVLPRQGGSWRVDWEWSGGSPAPDLLGGRCLQDSQGQSKEEGWRHKGQMGRGRAEPRVPSWEGEAKKAGQDRLQTSVSFGYSKL